MSDARRFRELFKRLVRGEMIAMHFAFLCIVEEYLGPHPDAWGQSQTLGVLKSRAVVKPKQKKVKHGGKDAELKEIWNVPVSWGASFGGGFMIRMPLVKGDVVMVVVSERALDRLIVDRKAAHPEIKEICRIDDAVVIPFGVRMDKDPLTPMEALDCLYVARLDADGLPISKIMLKPDGEVKIVCPKFTLSCPDINIVRCNIPEDEKWAARLGDKDDDSGCPGNSGSDALVEGSQPCRIADESDYAPGLTEETVQGSGKVVTEQPSPPKQGEVRPRMEPEVAVPEEEGEGE
jgi:hypothetical protein